MILKTRTNQASWSIRTIEKLLAFALKAKSSTRTFLSGEKGKTMLVRLSGGRDEMIEPVILISNNDSPIYPIQGVPDNVPGVAYRTCSRDWVDTKLFPLLFHEQSVIKKLLYDRRWVLFVDNCVGQNHSGEL